MTMSVTAAVTQNPGGFTSFTNHCLTAVHFLAAKVSTVVTIIFGAALGSMQIICGSALLVGGIMICCSLLSALGKILDVHFLNSPDLRQ